MVNCKTNDKRSRPGKRRVRNYYRIRRRKKMSVKLEINRRTSFSYTDYCVLGIILYLYTFVSQNDESEREIKRE